MGSIIAFFHPTQREMTPDRALEILYDTLTAQASRTSGGEPVEASSDGSACRECGTDQTPSYAEWCRRLGLPRYKLDRYLRKEVGCSGQELVDKIYSSSQSPTCE